MKTSILTLILFSLTLTLYAQPASDENDLKELLNEFLEGASFNDPEVHDRFWAEDLIYTGSAGDRTVKADIMSEMTEPTDYSSVPEVKYHGEEIQVNLYGNTAVVAFKLVAVNSTSGERTEYYNTGTFLKREGKWKAVAWQATRIP